MCLIYLTIINVMQVNHNSEEHSIALQSLFFNYWNYHTLLVWIRHLPEVVQV